jgi:hypothetical protein
MRRCAPAAAIARAHLAGVEKDAGAMGFTRDARRARAVRGLRPAGS